MRIAISADNDNGYDSVVSPHFGRCPFFVLVDVEDGTMKTVHTEKNPYFPNHQPGQIPKFISELGADVMLAGGMGRRAIMMFDQLGVQGVTGAYGSIRQAVERYLSGDLTGADPCLSSQSHHSTDHSETGYEKDEIGRLREEAEMLKAQLDEATKKIETIDKDRKE